MTSANTMEGTQGGNAQSATADVLPTQGAPLKSAPSEVGPSLDLAVIGNCMIAALIDRQARIVWSCFPRFDADPVFCHLLGGDAAQAEAMGGDFSIELVGGISCTQSYIENTAVLVSVLEDAQGRRGRNHRFRAPLQPLRPHVPAASDRAPRAPDQRSAAHSRAPEAPLRLGRAGAGFDARVEPSALRRPSPNLARHH